MNEQATHAALMKVFSAWLLVGLSQMTPLQWVQFLAAIGATIFTVAQTFFLLRDKWWRERNQRRK